jgi:hypothetical protein
MQFQRGTARANGTSLPCAQISINLRIRMVNARPDELARDSSSERGLCRPIWASLRACKLQVPAAMHMGCTRPTGSSRLACGKPPPMACPCAAAACQRKSHFKVSYRCASWAWAGPRILQLASYSAGDGGREASATFGYIESIMRAPSAASDHNRNESHPEPILHRPTLRISFGEMLATTYPRRTALAHVPVLTVSDPKASSALRIKEEGKYES